MIIIAHELLQFSLQLSDLTPLGINPLVDSILLTPEVIEVHLHPALVLLELTQHLTLTLNVLHCTLVLLSHDVSLIQCFIELRLYLYVLSR